jgi:hypothetical protein
VEEQGKTDPIPVTESDQVDAAPPAAPQSETPQSPAAPQASGKDPAAEPEGGEGKDSPAEVARKNDPQRRIDRLTRNWRTAERSAAYERGRAEAAEKELERLRGATPRAESPARSPGDTPATKEPEVEDFDNLKEWSRAHARWEAAQAQTPSTPKDGKPAGTPEAPATQGKDDAPPQLDIKVTDKHRESLARAQEAHEDLDEVLADGMTQLPASALVAAHDFDNAPELLYALVKDGNLERFAGMTDRQVMREVWKFAEKHAPGSTPSETPQATAGGEGKGEPQTPKPEPAASRAGPVPTTVSGAAMTNRSLPDLAENDIGSFIARRNADDKKAGYG